MRDEGRLARGREGEQGSREKAKERESKGAAMKTDAQKLVARKKRRKRKMREGDDGMARQQVEREGGGKPL